MWWSGVYVNRELCPAPIIVPIIDTCKLDAVWRRDGPRRGSETSRRQGVKASFLPSAVSGALQLAGHNMLAPIPIPIPQWVRHVGTTSSFNAGALLHHCNAVQTADLGSTSCLALATLTKMDHQTLNIGEFAQQFIKILTTKQPPSASICALQSAPPSHAHLCRASSMWNHRFRYHEHIVFDNMSGQLPWRLCGVSIARTKPTGHHVKVGLPYIRLSARRATPCAGGYQPTYGMIHLPSTGPHPMEQLHGLHC